MNTAGFFPESESATSGLGRNRFGDLTREFFAVLAELASMPLDTQAFLSNSRDDVEVHVHHCLMSAGAVILKHVVIAGTGRLADCSTDSGQDATKCCCA